MYNRSLGIRFEDLRCVELIHYGGGGGGGGCGGVGVFLREGLFPQTKSGWVY
jgi:hypothetical protein